MWYVSFSESAWSSTGGLHAPFSAVLLHSLAFASKGLSLVCLLDLLVNFLLFLSFLGNFHHVLPCLSFLARYHLFLCPFAVSVPHNAALSMPPEPSQGAQFRTIQH